jgi:predicted nucleic acid-binding protein
MAHPRYLFDTNIVTAHRLAALDKKFQMSAVVLSELMTATEPEEYEAYKALWLGGEREGRLIVPAAADWLPASRILHLLAQDRKKKSKGKSPRRTPTAKQELVMDVLIAVSAAREGVTVVTNDSDFEAIRYYHKKLKIKSGAEFFT